MSNILCRSCDLYVIQVDELKRELAAAQERVNKLQRILDSRPAINAGLPDTYIQWTQGVTEIEIRAALNVRDDG